MAASFRLDGKLLVLTLNGQDFPFEYCGGSLTKIERQLDRFFKRFNLSRESQTEILKALNDFIMVEAKKKEEKKEKFLNFSNFSISQCFQTGSQEKIEGGGGSQEGKGPFRKVEAFEQIFPIYERVIPIFEGDELAEIRRLWTLYALKKNALSPPILAIDRDGYINPMKRELALTKCDAQTLSLLSSLPQDKKRRLLHYAEGWGLLQNNEEEGDGRRGSEFNPSIFAPIFFTPVPKLRDTSFLREEKPIKIDGVEGALSWKDYVNKLVERKEGKDDRLKLIHKAKLLRPAYMKYAPHSIEATVGSTGKTAFYRNAGICVDKATPKSVIGFAKSPEEIYPGTVNNSELPVGFDQLESQTASQLARYMFNLMEYGEAWVDSGAVRFRVTTKSSFSYLSNTKPEGGLTALFIHLSTNPAIGRRFALILFEPRRDHIKIPEKKLSQKEEEDWEAAFSTFRAIEEYCLPKLKEIWRNEAVVRWVNSPIQGYSEGIRSFADVCQDKIGKEFLLSHTDAQHRVRAAAFQLALVDNLDKIALDEFSIEVLIEQAEEYLPEIVRLNLESARVMAESWGQLSSESLQAWFGSLPQYMKHIISAIILYKEANPMVESFNLKEIPYQAEDLDYLSKAIDRLKRSEKMKKTLEDIQEQLRVNIVEENGSFIVTFKEGYSKPPIKPLGRLVGQLETKPNEKISEGVSENIEKLRNLRNRENLEGGGGGYSSAFSENRPNRPTLPVTENPDPFKSVCCLCLKPSLISHYVNGRQACSECANKVLRGEQLP